jgi:hypothetical protein
VSESRLVAGNVAPGEYVPAGEGQGLGAAFTADQVAAAFGVAIDRVHRAMAGEFNLGADGRVDSRQAQHLAEVILGDEELAEREAALMRLGAYTPRADQDWGLGETAPGEESDRYAASADTLEDERASRRGSYDSSQPAG